MAKKEPKKTPNVAEQLKKFNANIADEEIVEKHDITKYGFKKKDESIVDELIISEVPNIPHEKISKEELLQLVQRVQTIQGGLKQEIIEGIVNDDYDVLRDKVLQLHTPDMRIINEILINL